MRRSLASQIKSVRFNVLLTTYEYVMKDKGPLSKVGVVGVSHDTLITWLLRVDEMEVHDNWRRSQDEEPSLQVDADIEPILWGTTQTITDRYSTTGWDLLIVYWDLLIVYWDLLIVYWDGILTSIFLKISILRFTEVFTFFFRTIFQNYGLCSISSFPPSSSLAITLSSGSTLPLPWREKRLMGGRGYHLITIN